MKLSNRDRRDWSLFLWLSLGAAAISACFGFIVGEQDLHSAMMGVLNSLAIATPILLFEIKGQRSGLARRLQRLPLLVYFGLRVLFYLAVIFAGLILVPLVVEGQVMEFDNFLPSVAFSVAMSVTANLVIELGLLLGFGTLKNLLTGRYVQPRREQRTFLLIDMRDSTGLAERLGPVRFHALLNDFFRDIADAALECDAEIHKYVGDEAILTWPGDALQGDDPLRCPFVVRDLIAQQARTYRARFGDVPSFRASLHCGEIVAGEIGDVRHEIAYVGETLNVAARLLEAAKELGRDVLVSIDLLERAPLPPDLVAEPLPTLSVRGRAAPLGIAALQRA
jgi:adenylate cyclase